MRLIYLMVMCESEVFEEVLKEWVNNVMCFITLLDFSEVTYIGFAIPAELLKVLLVAKRNGFAYQEVSEEEMNDKSFNSKTIMLAGNRKLGKWLH